MPNLERSAAAPRCPLGAPYRSLWREAHRQQVGEHLRVFVVRTSIDLLPIQIALVCPSSSVANASAQPLNLAARRGPRPVGWPALRSRSDQEVYAFEEWSLSVRGDVTMPILRMARARRRIFRHQLRRTGIRSCRQAALEIGSLPGRELCSYRYPSHPALEGSPRTAPG